MKNRRLNKMRWIVLLVLFAALLLVGTSFGRYRSSVGKDFSIEANQTGSLKIVSTDGWEQSGETMTLRFGISREDKENKGALLRLTATQGFPGNATVTLTVGGKEYKAVAEKIKKGSILFSQMGEGTVYLFYSEGKEIVWPLTESETMLLSVEGGSDSALLRLEAI